MGQPTIPASTNDSQTGAKSLGPLIDFLKSRQNELGAYLGAVATGMRAGAEALEKGTTPAESFIAGYFTQAASVLSQLEERVQSLAPGDIRSFIEEEGRKHPSVLLGVTTVAGIIVGRLGRQFMSGKSGAQTIH